MIIGAGAGGLRCASALPQGLRVAIACKGRFLATEATAFMEKGLEFSVVNAPIFPPDSAAAYYQDLIEMGAGLNDPAVVQRFAQDSEREFRFLESLDLPFVREGHGYKRIRLGGCRHPRSIICGPGFGRLLLKRLKGIAESKGFQFWENTPIIDLFVENGRVVGAWALREGRPSFIRVKAVVLASGGCGRLFLRTTNPPGIIGDGLRMAKRAGVPLLYPHLIQSLPLTVRPVKGFYLLSALLSQGRFSIDLDLDGVPPHRRMSEVLIRLSLAGETNWDGRHIPQETYLALMPRTFRLLKEKGCDLTQVPLTLAPFAHEMLGGIKVDRDGGTAIPNLFAVGEVAGGLHGRERINGTGVMKGLVFGASAAMRAKEVACGSDMPKAPPEPPQIFSGTKRLRRELYKLTDPLLGRAEKAHLKRALERLAQLKGEAKDIETTNMVATAQILIESALTDLS